MRPRDLQKLWLVPLLAVASLGAAGSDSSPVAQAVQNRDDARVRALLDQRADVNVPTADGTTALHWAVHWNDSETADLLIRAGANVNMANRYGATPLWLASERGYADVVGTLLKAGVDPNTLALGEGESPLMAAARAGSVETVELLLAHGADVNVKDAWRGQTALIMAAGNHEPNAEVVRVLLGHGADVHVRSAGGLTALLFAVRQHDVESVRLLLKAGANVNDQVAQAGHSEYAGGGQTPGGVSALRIVINHNYYDLAELLLDSGADPNAADSAGFTPLHAVVQKRAGGNPERGGVAGMAQEGGEGSIGLLKNLLARAADPNARLPLKLRPPNFNPNGYPEVNNVQYAGATPLWIAAHIADLEAMRILWAAGGDPLIPSMENTTALMVAAGLGYATRGPTSRLGGRWKDTEEAVIAVLEQLLEWGHDVNAVNDNGQTTLHGAVAAADPAVVQFLVDHGVSLDQKDSIGRTPFVMAEEHTTDKYRTNQSLIPADIQETYEALRRLNSND